MKTSKYIVILLLGLIIGFTAGQITPQTRAANEIEIVGESGILEGFDIISDGETLCSDPYVSTDTQEISCD